MLTGKTGTLMYMAPELYRSEPYCEKVDVFSFGVIMYELMHKYMMIFAITNKGTEEEIESYASKVRGTGLRGVLRPELTPKHTFEHTLSKGSRNTDAR
jgi:serine/threonine protein kinase